MIARGFRPVVWVFMIGAAVRGKIKESLAVSLHRTEAVLDQVNARHKSRTARLVSVLSEQAELKVGLGLTALLLVPAVPALANRPELAESKFLVEAAVQALRQQQFAPLIPSVVLGVSESRICQVLRELQKNLRDQLSDR